MPSDLTRIGATGLIACALGSGVGILLAKLPASEGDLLSFAGAMLGAAITVAGAFYVVNWQADADSRRYRSSLVAILEDAMRHIGNCEKPTELYGETAPKMQKKHAEMAMKMINVAKRMTMQRVPDTPDLARAYMLIAEMDIDIEKLDEVLEPSRFYGGVTDVSECTKLTKTAVTSAIDRLKGIVP